VIAQIVRDEILIVSTPPASGAVSVPRTRRHAGERAGTAFAL
jgi:hypothetical protein